MLKIRLNRIGTKKRPFYRIVAIDSHKARGGKFADVLGTYSSIDRPAKITLEEEKIFKRLDQGAELSETVASIFKRTGLTKKYLMMKNGENVSEIKLSDTIKERQKKKRKKTAKAE